MAARKLWLALCLLSIIFTVIKAGDHFFEFGDNLTGEEYYVKEGTINVFSYNNTFEIPEIRHKMLTGVKVIVTNSLSKPNVTLETPRKVHIHYKFPQWTHGNYKIIARGFHIY
ncbi:uncharacterized protein LOC125232381 [Leguminivora glycinivorella]|uniref:uncharacterized protein LOC125232381 n=1 Tax=Leguminivora glycinivorella TaxID=1035111 RepID=UPI00200CA911|nr:uncharacterized protein LOC125232381 [Leguminivora glycinivorella]